MRAKNVTIKDVADYLGIAPSSVSHALTGRRRISAELVARVNRACQKLGYQPDFAAQAFRSRATGMIGIVVTDFNNAHSAEVFAQVSAQLLRHGYLATLCLANSLDDADGLAILRKISNGRFDGIINMLPQVSPADARRAAGKTPILTFLRQDLAPITMDYAAAAREMLEYLFALGHRRIGYTAISSRNYGGEDPFALACGDILRRAGLFDERLCFVGADDFATGRQAAAYFADLNVTAIFAGNDNIAAGIYQWANARDWKIPRDWSVIGADDTPFAQVLHPPLSSVNLNFPAVIEHTVNTLIAQIRGAGVAEQPLTITPSLIKRESVSENNNR
jgi:DNA-binding LacI/PurR family transcriptional regulator